MPISYVGGQVNGRAGVASTATITFSLTGGSNTTPQAGDLVIITAVVGSQARNPAQAISGYTALGQLNPNATTYDTSLNVSWKFMGATPDTTFTLPSTGNIADAQRYTVQVFRGVDPTTPFDATAVPASGTGTGRPNPGAILPVTAGAWVVICGGGAAGTGANYVAPTNFTTNFLTGFTADTNDAMVGSGYWSGWTSGSVDPAAYTGGTTNAADSWAAYTLALRPAPAPSAQSLTQNTRFDNSNTYYSPTVSKLVYPLTAVRFDNTQSFYSPTATILTYPLTPATLENTSVFYSPLVTQASANVTLLPPLFENSNTFYTDSVIKGAITISASLLENSNQFYSGTISTAYTAVADLYTNSNTFFVAAVSVPGSYIFRYFDGSVWQQPASYTTKYWDGSAWQIITKDPVFY